MTVHVEGIRLFEGEQVIAEQARLWAVRREEQAEADYRLARRFLEKAPLWAEMPVVQQTLSDDGTTTVITPWASARRR